ncbi:MAG TPA: hypothetical protein VJR05_11085 [Acidimicrobiia bacterium]|nr:hypothetical protein [Acidimicrobiia bacterium]
MTSNLLDGHPDTWVVTEDRFIPSLASARESVFTIGNGYLSTRGSFEERIEGEVRSTFIQGLFVTPPGELPLLGAVPDWTEVTLTINGHPFSVEAKGGGYRRQLDLRRGVLERDVLWRTADTGVVKVGFRRLVSMADRHLAALEITLTALTAPVDVWLETGLDTSVPSPELPAFNPLHWARPERNRLRLEAETVDGLNRLEVETVFFGPGRQELIRDPRHHRFAAGLVLQPGQPAVFTKFVTYHASRDPDPPPSLPDPDASFDAILTGSARAWGRQWRAANIEVGGDAMSERALRFAAFQIIGASPASDSQAAIGAKLASGFGYRHHVFWDTDIFIAPYLSVTLPALARNHLRYRYVGLDGARRKAKKYGRRGAFYAWESAATGDEVTPEWSSPLFGPPSRIWTGEIEEHITADVAYAVDHYWRWTGDHRLLAQAGLEIILEGASYWASRIEMEGGRGHIRRVIGPDEYHSHVDDSFYTNLLASWHLRRAAELWEWSATHRPRATAALTERLRLEDADRSRWRQLARSLHLGSNQNGVWEQHAGFFRLERVDLADFQPRRMSMYELLGEDRIENTQVIKQADVVMAMALLADATGGLNRRRANWAFYLPRCDHGSSLSMAVHARVAADLGMGDISYRMFQQAIAIDLEDSMGNGHSGLHAATQGGILQAAIFGFAGLRLEGGEPVTRPRLPEHWQSLGFSFLFHGTRHERELTASKQTGRATTSSKRTKKGETI